MIKKKLKIRFIDYLHKHYRHTLEILANNGTMPAETTNTSNQKMGTSDSKENFNYTAYADKYEDLKAAVFYKAFSKFGKSPMKLILFLLK